ncbi:MAG: hypothetical protein DWI58_00830 [Chloroflexi bacterium]|nr:MAG: hypothetical protein DWI58_00830 [Chloroflexota bacterium]
MTPEEREELLAACALGTLPSREAATVEALVRSDSAAARSLASYHEIVDMVALSVPLRRADPALRTHVLAAARAGTPTRAPWSASRIAAFVAASAASMLLVVWGVNLQRGLAQQSRDTAAIAAVVEASAKQLQQLAVAGVSAQASEDLRAQLQTAVADQEALIAISADSSARAHVLETTSAGHGARARYLWSPELGAGVLVARGLPDLPLDSVYQIWLNDGSRVYSGGTFTPDERSMVQKVIRVAAGARSPLRVTVTVSPVGGSATAGRLVVLSGSIER